MNDNTKQAVSIKQGELIYEVLRHKKSKSVKLRKSEQSLWITQAVTKYFIRILKAFSHWTGVFKSYC